MQVDLENRTIKCFWCNKDIKLNEVCLDVIYEGSLSCNKDHIIGHQTDLEWLFLVASCQYFYIYHNKGHCRCVQEECNCFGVEDECSFPLGRKSFEEK